MSPRNARKGRARTRRGTHVPVLKAEVLEALAPAPGDIAADCTVGYGGHARQILRRITPGGRLVAMDVDQAALKLAKGRLGQLGGASFHHRNFSELPEALADEGLAGCDVVLADLGASSMQMDDEARGFSYAREGPLDMRMDERLETTAADLLATMSAKALAAALRDLSDEPDAETIAAWIANQRQVAPIEDTQRLLRLVLDAKGVGRDERKAEPWRRLGGAHPAARTFQALRILVNRELEALEALLEALPGCLRPGGRVAILSFHNGEDRLVKNAFRERRREGVYEATSPKPIVPTRHEARRNPRGTSARLRWARRARE